MPVAGAVTLSLLRCCAGVAAAVARALSLPQSLDPPILHNDARPHNLFVDRSVADAKKMPHIVPKARRGDAHAPLGSWRTPRGGVGVPKRRACAFHLGNAQVRLGDFGGAQQRNTTWKSPLNRAGPKDRIPPWALDAQVGSCRALARARARVRAHCKRRARA